MAFQQDPRYAQSPYQYQPQFGPPQHNNPAFGYGHPVAPTPLAPPQAYAPNRPQPPYNPHPQAPGQPGFPTQFANAGQYQHNAQYNPNMGAGSGPMSYQPPQPQFPQLYNNRNFQQHGPPPPPGQMGGMPASSPTNFIPPPIPPPALPQQPPGSVPQWSQAPGLPPKPPTVGYRESVELQSGHDSGSSNRPLPLPGLEGNHGTNTDAPGSGQQIPMFPMQHNESPRTKTGNRDMRGTGNQIQTLNGNRPPSHITPVVIDQAPSQNDHYSPASPGMINPMQHAGRNASNDNREESPDMYSPQLHPQRLPGLGQANYNPGAPKMQNDAVEAQKTSDEMYSPPAVVSSFSTAIPSASSNRNALPPPPKIDPIEVKGRASQAVKELYANGIQFLDIAGNGIHPNVLRNLCLELGLELETLKTKAKSKSKEKENNKKQTNAKESVKKDSAKSQAASTAKKVTEPVKKPAVKTQEPPKDRADYLARLQAAKGVKSADAEPGDSMGTAKSAETSSNIAEEAASNSEDTTKATPAKKSEPKSKEQNAILRQRLEQRLEQLRKETAEKQKKDAEQAAKVSTASSTPLQVKTSKAAKSNKSNGLPGLSMFDAEAEEPDEEDEYMEDDDASIQEDDHSDSGVNRKRSLEYDPHSELSHAKRRAGSQDDSQIVIEVSDDEEEEGEVTPVSHHGAPQRQLSGTGVGLEAGQNPDIQGRLDALAAQEEEIRLYKQKIQLLEAKKRAKRAVDSNNPPTPAGTPSQAQPLTQTPAGQQSSQAGNALAAAGEKVQAQQVSLEAQKSLFVNRLEQEEARDLVGHGTPKIEQREQRIRTLRASIEKLDAEISRAEAEKQRIQEEIERGIEGREEFSRELQKLLAEMEVEDAKEAAEISELAVTHEDVEPAATENVEDRSDGPEDDQMDISESEDEEGEISDDENGEKSAKGSPEAEAEAEPSSPGEDPEITQQVASGHESADDHSDADSDNNERTYSPQQAASDDGSDDEMVDYEPDYEPDAEPEVEVEVEAGSSQSSDEASDSDEEVPADDDQETVQAQYPETAENHEESPAVEQGVTLPGLSASHVSPKDLSDSEDEGSEEGEMADDNENDDAVEDDASASGSENVPEPEDVAESGESSGLYSPSGHDAGIQDQTAHAETDPDHHSEEEGAEAEEVLMEESSESEVSEEEGTNTVAQHVGYVPYASPLTGFKSYRFHAQYVNHVSGGYQSLTFSHRINFKKPVCNNELLKGVCRNESSCRFQHFHEMKLSDDDLILELGSLNEGTTSEQREKYVTGLRELLVSLRARGPGLNVSLISQELAAYRSRFWGDPSRIIRRNREGH